MKPAQTKASTMRYHMHHNHPMGCCTCPGPGSNTLNFTIRPRTSPQTSPPKRPPPQKHWTISTLPESLLVHTTEWHPSHTDEYLYINSNARSLPLPSAPASSLHSSTIRELEEENYPKLASWRQSVLESLFRLRRPETQAQAIRELERIIDKLDSTTLPVFMVCSANRQPT